ncbi:hypothetical protein WJX82_008707 [Trebouxia sp. C0006]
MISQADIQSLKDYVKGPSSQNQADSTVRLQVTHSNLKAHFMEIRLDLHMSVGSVKQKLMSHTGSSPGSMQLQLKDETGRLLSQLSEDSRLLGFYSPYDGCIIHVIDTDASSKSASGWLEDTSKVQKYVMSDEDYAKRENTYKQYKLMKQKEDPEWTAEKELCTRKGIPYQAPKQSAKIEDNDYMLSEAASLQPGSRCEVNPGGKRGLIRHVGRCQKLPKGYWVGVQYDEPVGKNNGTVKGVQYFDCLDGYGAFVRPDMVTAGDFPPVDDLFSDEDEI